MVSTEIGQQLHDRATRGKALSAEEQMQLEEWYAIQDHTEMARLGLTEKAQPEESAESLRVQIDSALARITTITKRIQELTAENDALRREISTLQRQLVQQSAPQLV
jgi:predicted RNase H-like nuclease (RuvC/YqgF family)